MPDSAQPLAPLSAEEEAMVRAYGRCDVLLARAVDIDMIREQHPPLSEYTTMQVLSEAPDRQLRMKELAIACGFSHSGMSRIVNKMESAGLVERVRSDDDGRGFHAVLTEAGLQRLEQAWPSNLASVRRHIFDHLDGIDLAPVTKALQLIADALDGGPASVNNPAGRRS
jgi:DNA-binding MarR family transcriptional regulator